MRHPNISGRHCLLRFQDGYWYIQDLGSTNGVKVNGVRIQQDRVLLRPGSEISIAKREFTIAYTPPVGSGPVG
jgi:pSer/pThr/pTyr-binding forkhead associated (FHA) protein